MNDSRMRCSFTAAATCLLLLTGTQGAWGEITQCDGGGALGSGAGKITSVPQTITAPGVYCVTTKITSNLSSGAAITINANNVVLDLNDFAIGNLGAGATTTAIGVYATDRQNITIRNGTLRGFFVGVALIDGTAATSSGHLVQNITTDTSYLGGIVVQGRAGRVNDNKVMHTVGANSGSSPFPTTNNLAVGIDVSRGDGALVRNNSVLNTDCSNACVSGSSAAGVVVNASSSAGVLGNRLMNTAVPTATSSAGIELSNGNGVTTTNALVRQNVMANWQYGIVFSSPSTGEYAQNGAQGVTTPYNNGGTIVTNGGANF